MTEKYSFIASLKSTLPEESWPWVIPALRQDDLIWQSLQDPKFGEQALRHIGSQPDDWSPASLALLASGYNQHISLDTLNPEIRQNALHAFEQFVKPASPHAYDRLTLAKSGLLAIALVERFNRVGSWLGLEADLRNVPVTSLKTPIACLCGITPDRDGLLRFLAGNSAPQEYQELLIHAVLCMPQRLHDHAKTLHAILKDLPLSKCLHALTHLKKLRPNFATSLARLFLESQPTLSNRRSFPSYQENLEQISQLLRSADIFDIANLPSQAASLRSLALETTRELHTGISTQLANAFAQKGDLEASLSSWQGSDDLPVDFGSLRQHIPPVDLVLALLKTGNVEDALALLKDHENQTSIHEGALYQLTSARDSLSQGLVTEAQEKARQALAEVKNLAHGSLDSIGWGNSPQTQAVAQVSVELARLLLEVSLTREAVEAYEAALILEPDSTDLLIEKARTQRIAGDAAAAISTSHLAVALDPSVSRLRRELVANLEAAGDWESAYQERTALLEDRFAEEQTTEWPAVEDLQELAACALKARHPERTTEICEQLLEANPEDHTAQALLGEALAATGKIEAALIHLQKATQLVPHQSAAWLALARVRKAGGENARAIETLRTASNAIPDDPAILLALSEEYLDENSLTSALSSLRKAYDLATSSQTKDSDGSTELSARIAVLLGQTLTRLGHLDEANPLLEKAYQAHPVYPELAGAYAKVLLATGEPVRALEPLEIAMQAQPENPEAFVDYARALLAAGQQPEKAIQALQTALRQAEDDRPEIRSTAQGLLAEALAASGDLNAALQAYYHALDTQKSDDPEWYSRLSFGLGVVALDLKQPEIAVANLREAARVDSRNPEIHRKLAEAYTATKLFDEALASARTAKELASEDVDLLHWFADQALLLGAQAEALSALHQAVMINPQRTDLLIRLSQLNIEIGEKQLALETLSGITSLDNPDLDHLYQAAQLMLDLDDAPSAVVCLERVRAGSTAPDPGLLYTLANAHYQAGDMQQSLETLDYAIQVNPGNLALYELKTELLLSQSQIRAAKETLQRALELHPHNRMIQLRLAKILRRGGQIQEALNAAEQVVGAYRDKPFIPPALAARALAAELARASLRSDDARSLLSIELSGDKKDTDTSSEGSRLHTSDERHQADQAAALPFYCLSAEMALDEDEEIAAAEALTRAFELAPEHPQVIALQARLTLRRGDHRNAIQTLQTAVEAAEREYKQGSSPSSQLDENTSESGLFLAVAAAATEFRQWETALYFAHRVIKAAPLEAFAHTQLARTLVLRAEDQRLSDALDVITHAPGSDACSDAVFQTFEKALKSACGCLAEAHEGEVDEEPQVIRRWRARGMAIFRPDHESLQVLEDLPAHKPEDYAARIALLRILGEMSGIAQLYKLSQEGVKPLPKHHLVLAQLALSLGSNGRRQRDLDDSIATARAAIDQQPGQPLYHFLLARLAKKQEDIALALRSIQTALSIWPDEPRWQATAAELHLACDDPPAAIVHLRDAIRLEPQHLTHYLLLGEAYLRHGDVQQAIQTYEQARNVDPDHFQPYISLARAHLLRNDQAKATGCVERAINMAPNQIEPLLLRAEIALDARDPRGALNRAQAALAISPDHVLALHLQARALTALGRFADAQGVLERAISLAEDPLQLMLEEVELVSKSQGTSAALGALQELASQYPQEAMVLARLTMALAQAGKRDETIRAAQQALRLDGLSASERAHLLYVLGKHLRQAGQLDQAIYQLNEAIRQDPSMVAAYLELGAVHQDRRQHTQALDAYRRAIDVAPDNPQPYYEAGLLLKEGRDYQGAEDMLRRAAHLARNDVNIHRQLGALVAINLVHSRKTLPIDS